MGEHARDAAIGCASGIVRVVGGLDGVRNPARSELLAVVDVDGGALELDFVVDSELDCWQGWGGGEAGRLSCHSTSRAWAKAAVRRLCSPTMNLSVGTGERAVSAVRSSPGSTGLRPCMRKNGVRPLRSCAVARYAKAVTLQSLCQSDWSAGDRAEVAPRMKPWSRSTNALD